MWNRWVLEGRLTYDLRTMHVAPRHSSSSHSYKIRITRISEMNYKPVADNDYCCAGVLFHSFLYSIHPVVIYLLLLLHAKAIASASMTGASM